MAYEDEGSSMEESLYDTPQQPPRSPRSAAQQPEVPEPQEEPQEPQEEPQGIPEPDLGELPEFDPQHRQALTGLMFLGRLEDDFEWLGHKFVIRTLTAGEQVEVGMLVKPYLGTRVEWRAYQAAMLGAAVVSVDGEPISVPLVQNDGVSDTRRKFEYILKNWYSPIIDAVYQRINVLEIQSRAVLDAMGKVGG